MLVCASSITLQKIQIEVHTLAIQIYVFAADHPLFHCGWNAPSEMVRSTCHKMILKKGLSLFNVPLGKTCVTQTGSSHNRFHIAFHSSGSGPAEQLPGRRQLY